MATKRNFKSIEEFVEFNQNLCEVLRSIGYKKEVIEDEIKSQVEDAHDKYYEKEKNNEMAFEEWLDTSKDWEAINTRNNVKNYKAQLKIWDEIIIYLMEVK